MRWNCRLVVLLFLCRSTLVPVQGFAPITPFQATTNKLQPTTCTANHNSNNKRLPVVVLHERVRQNSDDPPSSIIPSNALSIVSQQSLLIPLSIGLATVLDIPNYGLGPSIDLNPSSILGGCLCVLPLAALAYLLDQVEDQYPALQNVTKATQRAVLLFLGNSVSSTSSTTTILSAVGIGLAAGLGEEWLFRGVIQYQLTDLLQGQMVYSVAVSSVLFGLLHAVTPLYALLATLASVYFGTLYSVSDNLCVPVVCHAVYDIGALLYAHYEVCQMSEGQVRALLDWEGPLGDEKNQA